MYVDTKAEVLPEVPVQPQPEQLPLFAHLPNIVPGPEQVVLHEAAEKLRSYGWIKGSYGDDEIGYCMIGAIGIPHGTSRARLLRTAIFHMSKLLGYDGEDYDEAEAHVVMVNDTFIHDRDQAVGILEKAAGIKPDLPEYIDGIGKTSCYL